MLDEKERTILVVEDSKTTLAIIKKFLSKWGYNVLTAEDGNIAWVMIQKYKPKLVLLDWLAPGLDGVSICRKLREADYDDFVYIIMITALTDKEAIVYGLSSGADDYMTKPFEPEELKAKIDVGWRALNLETELENKIQQLETNLEEVKKLSGLLPMCSYCKKIRNDANYWNNVEEYISAHSEAEFNHGVCPDCYEKHVVPQLNELKKKREKRAVKEYSD